MSTDRDEVLGSGKWVRSRTIEELNYHVDGNMPGSRIHDACLQELRCRQADLDRAEEMRWIKATFAATIILGIAAIAAPFLAAP